MGPHGQVRDDPPVSKNDVIVVTGAGGFIGGNLVMYLRRKGFVRIRAVDKRPLDEWYLRVPGVENTCLDVSSEDNCNTVCEGAVEVYNLAADMGGMGFIEGFDPNYLLFERAAGLQRTGLAQRALVPVEALPDLEVPNPVSKGVAEVMARQARLKAWERASNGLRAGLPPHARVHTPASRLPRLRSRGHDFGIRRIHESNTRLGVGTGL